jgi:hypothetical protein
MFFPAVGASLWRITVDAKQSFAIIFRHKQIHNNNNKTNSEPYPVDLRHFTKGM